MQIFRISIKKSCSKVTIQNKINKVKELIRSIQHSIHGLSTQNCECQVQQRLCKRFHTAGTNRHLNLSFFWQASEDPLKRPYRI